MMKMNKRTILFLLNVALWNLAANFAHPVTPTVIKNLQLHDYMFGVAFSCMMISNFLFSPFWGKLNNYLSSRVSLLIGCCGYGAGQLMFMLAKTEPQIILARLFAGIFTGGIMVSMLTYTVNTATLETRGRALTIQATLQGIFSAFGFMIGGLLGEISTNFTFLVQAVTLCLSGVLFFFICEDDSTQRISELSRGEFIRDVNPFAAFIASRRFMSITFFVLFSLATVQNLGYYAYEHSFNYYIKDYFGLTSSYNGMIKGTIGIITLVANFTICMWMLNHTNIRKSLTMVFGACTVSLCVVLFINDVVPFMLVNIVYFAFNAISMPLVQNLIAERSQEGDGNLIMGYYNAMRSLGGIIGALAAGFLYTVWPKNIFILAGAAYLSGTALSAVYYKMGKRGDPESQNTV